MQLDICNQRTKARREILPDVHAGPYLVGMRGPVFSGRRKMSRRFKGAVREVGASQRGTDACKRLPGMRDPATARLLENGHLNGQHAVLLTVPP